MSNFLIDLITKNSTIIEAAFAAIFVASATTMPKTPPKDFGEFWTWLREIVQTINPARRAEPYIVPVPPTPVQEVKQQVLPNYGK